MIAAAVCILRFCCMLVTKDRRVLALLPVSGKSVGLAETLYDL